jgi:hypothetical protein
MPDERGPEGDALRGGIGKGGDVDSRGDTGSLNDCIA